MYHLLLPQGFSNQLLVCTRPVPRPYIILVHVQVQVFMYAYCVTMVEAMIVY